MLQAQTTGRRLARARRHELRGARAALKTVTRVAVAQAQEAALLLSVPTTVPLRILRGDNRAANADAPQTQSRVGAASPVLLVHGFGGAKSSWSAVEQALSTRGLTVDAMAYAPVGNSVEQLADKLVAHVERTLARTGAQKVHLVGHSLGGVIIAQAISGQRLNGRVGKVITLGSPFGGSPWASALPVVDLVRALRPGSALLRRLASMPLPEGVRWLSVTATLDIVVPGLRSVPPHPQAENITVRGVGHLGMLLNPRVIEYVTTALCAGEVAIAAEPAMCVLRTAS